MRLVEDGPYQARYIDYAAAWTRKVFARLALTEGRLEDRGGRTALSVAGATIAQMEMRLHRLVYRREQEREQQRYAQNCLRKAVAALLESPLNAASCELRWRFRR